MPRADAVRSGWRGRAAAATYITTPVYSLNSYLAGPPRATAVLTASTGDTAPLIQHSYSAAAPYTDLMVLEIEPGDFVRIKPRHTFSNDGNPHNVRTVGTHHTAGTVGWQRGSLWVRDRITTTAMTIVIVDEWEARWNATAVVTRLAELAVNDQLIVVCRSNEHRSGPDAPIVTAGLRDRLPRHDVVGLYIAAHTGASARCGPRRGVPGDRQPADRRDAAGGRG